MANVNSVEELENQLHRQYAENNNNRISTFISFIVGIIALFGFYGYVYVNVNTNSRGNWNFNTDEFLLMSFVTISILFFLAILALNLGYSFRRDQFVVHNIRIKRYRTEEEMEKIFGKRYSPPEKNRSLFKKIFSLFQKKILHRGKKSIRLKKHILHLKKNGVIFYLIFIICFIGYFFVQKYF